MPMAGATAELPRARLAGTLLTVCGVVGVLSGALPLTVNFLRMLGFDWGMSPETWADHGVEAMGLGIEWAVLSCVDGTFLGGLLLAAGYGWWRGRRWAPLVTLIYCIHGLLVTGADLAIFATRAKVGSMRTEMLILDGLACAVALTTLLLLTRWWLHHPPATPTE